LTRRFDVAPIPPATIAANTSAAAKRGRRRPTITALDAIKMTSDAFEAIARGGLVIRAAARGLPSIPSEPGFLGM